MNLSMLSRVSFKQNSWFPHQGFIEFDYTITRGMRGDALSTFYIRILTLQIPAPYVFAPRGRRAFLSIQHSDDTLMPLVDDYPTDDVLLITGFRVR